MSLRKLNQFVFSTTPDDLRRIADILEAKFKVAKLGEDVPYWTEWGVDCELKITIDQEEMHRNGHVPGRKTP